MLTTDPTHSLLPSIRRPRVRRSFLTVICMLAVAGCQGKTNHLEESRKAVEQTAAPEPEAASNDSENTVAGHESALTEVDQRVIAWFDSLDFPDFAHLKLVRVATGGWR